MARIKKLVVKTTESLEIEQILSFEVLDNKLNVTDDNGTVIGTVQDLQENDDLILNHDCYIGQVIKPVANGYEMEIKRKVNKKYLRARNNSIEKEMAENYKILSGLEFSEEAPYNKPVYPVISASGFSSLSFSKDEKDRFAVINPQKPNDFDKEYMGVEELKKLMEDDEVEVVLEIVEKLTKVVTVRISYAKKLKKVGEKVKIKKTIKDIVSEITFVEAGELNERIHYMKNLQMRDEDIVEILERYEPEENCLKPESLYINEKKTKTQDCLIKEMLLDILDGHNVLLEGPKSVGKNVAWETVAWLLNMEIFVCKISNTTTNDDVFGGLVTDNSATDLLREEDAKAFVEVHQGNGDEKILNKAASFALNQAKASSTHLVFKEGILTRALVKGRGIFIFDEMDMGNANFLSSILNTLCDDHSQKFEIPGYGVVPLSQRLIVGGTQNGSEYIGTQPQNPATMSRFSEYKLPNLPDIKKILMEEDIDVDENVINKLSTIYQELYDKVESGEISDVCLNIRGFKRALRNIKRGFSINRAIENQIANICPLEEKEVIMDILI